MIRSIRITSETLVSCKHSTPLDRLPEAREALYLPLVALCLAAYCGISSEISHTVPAATTGLVCAAGVSRRRLLLRRSFP